LNQAVALGLALSLVATPTDVFAQERPTIQKRFASKSGHGYVHGLGIVHVRNDFYDTWGGGADVGYYLNETLGFELRAVGLRSTLSDAARNLKETVGLVPDARPQDAHYVGGARLSLGYGKVLVGQTSVVHFDPQLFFLGGVGTAENRMLPTLYTGLSLLTHLRWGLQIKADLAFTAQYEERERGWVPAFGFAPILAVGVDVNRLFGGAP
jgi:outer membrane beta-barrel protein